MCYQKEAPGPPPVLHRGGNVTRVKRGKFGPDETSAMRHRGGIRQKGCKETCVHNLFTNTASFTTVFAVCLGTAGFIGNRLLQSPISRTLRGVFPAHVHAQSFFTHQTIIILADLKKFVKKKPSRNSRRFLKCSDKSLLGCLSYLVLAAIF